MRLKNPNQWRTWMMPNKGGIYLIFTHLSEEDYATVGVFLKHEQVPLLIEDLNLALTAPIQRNF